MEDNNKTQELASQAEFNIEELKNAIVGIKRSAVNFDIEVKNDFSIVVKDEDNFTVAYPMLKKNASFSLNTTWYFLAMWIVAWDDESQKAIAGFLGRIVYPCAMALSFEDRNNFMTTISKAVDDALAVQYDKFAKPDDDKE